MYRPGDRTARFIIFVVCAVALIIVIWTCSLAEAAGGGGGEEAPQQQMIEDVHDPGEHFSWHHAHTYMLCAAIITAIGGVAAAWLKHRKKHA